jgi:hypothetical protein
MYKSLYFLFALTLLLSACSKDGDDPVNDNTAPIELTEQEKSDLLFLIEEEKMARDVYLFSGSLYKQNIFQNIPESEQIHIDRIKSLLEKYNLEDPTEGNAEGEFANPDIQMLYDQLTADASESLMKALIAGATIEDLDIADLISLPANTDKEDLISTYEFLLCGSKNHMRGFMNQISSNGGTYTPQYISEELFNEILQSGHESCGQYQ